MKYFEALKIYNQGQSSYCSPKKGTAEHAKVLAIQRGEAPPVAPKPNPPSATGVKMRRGRKTGGDVSLAVPPPPPKVMAAAMAEAKARGGKLGLRMPRKAVKIGIPKPKKADAPAMSYADAISLPAPVKKMTYADVISIPKTHMTYSDVLMMPPRPKANSSGNVMDMSRSGAVSEAPMPRPEPLPSPFVLPTDDNDDTGAGAGIRGKEAGKMINLALKGRIARKKMKELEKDFLFDIFTR